MDRALGLGEGMSVSVSREVYHAIPSPAPKRQGCIEQGGRFCIIGPKCVILKVKMKSMKKFIALLVALLPFTGLQGQAQAQNTQMEDLDAQYAATLLKTGTEAPDFTLDDIQGKAVSLSNFSGRKVVLVFWASWCPDCRAEVPELKALSAAVDPAKVAFVSVSFDRTLEALQQYVGENYLPGVQLFDPAGKKESKVAELYGVKWIPSLYLIGEQGKVELGTVMLEKVSQALKAQTMNKPGRQLCSDESCAL